MRISKQQVARAVRIVGFLLVLSWAVWQTGVATVERGAKNDLIEVLKRRSPITDYQSAEFGHTDCRKNYEDAFLAAVGQLIATQRGDPASVSAAAEVAHYTDVLAHVEEHCPTPRAPEFADDGKMRTAPFLPTTTTSTTRPVTVPAEPQK